MDSKEFLNKENGWTKGSTGMFDTNSLADLLDRFAEQKQIANTKIRVHGENLEEGKFEELARPMVKYLCENYYPYVTVIITPTSAELLEGLKTIGRVEDYIRD